MSDRQGNFHFFPPQNSNEFIVQLSFKGGSDDSQLQTRLRKIVAVVLGVTPDVVLFDKTTTEYKKHPKDTYCYERFMDELVKIQTGILKKLRELNDALREWDKNYFLKNNHLPTFAHVNQDEEGKQLTRKMKYAKVLLTEWKWTSLSNFLELS